MTNGGAASTYGPRELYICTRPRAAFFFLEKGKRPRAGTHSEDDDYEGE